MTITLRPYQVIGKDFLKPRRHALLADDMGLGKTPQAIFAAHELGLKNILVVCPAVAKFNWQNEFLKFINRASYVAGDGETHHKKHTVICSFEYAAKFTDLYKKRAWDLIIVDEWHFLKEPSATRTKNIIGRNGIIHSSKRLWALTGTPAPNHAGELWTVLFTFGFTSLSYDGFIAKYCKSHFKQGIGYQRLEITGTNVKTAPELKGILKKMSLRRLKKNVLKDLPSISHNQLYIKGESDEKLFKSHPELKLKMRLELEKLKEELGYDFLDIGDHKLLDSLSFLADSISSLRRYHGLKKVSEVAEIVVSELGAKAYEKIIIFGIHTDVLNSLKIAIKNKIEQTHLKKTFKTATITGKTKDRQGEVDRFQNDPDCRIFYGNIIAAGTAITLTAASEVLFIEQDFVPGNNRQACDRAHRYGQVNPVNVRYASIANSLDDKMTATILRKIKEIQTFLD